MAEKKKVDSSVLFMAGLAVMWGGVFVNVAIIPIGIGLIIAWIIMGVVES
jgi:hypothetical protein